jgi:hypothetical protein
MNTRLLTHLAWWNVAIHIIALLFALFGMRPGTPAVELEERRAYLAGAPLGWSLGWGCWMACAALQVGFYAALTPHLRQRTEAAWLAVTLAAAGAAIDLTCDVLWITVIPPLAAGGEGTTAVYLALERLGLAGGLVVANGLYCTATLILTLCLRGRPGVTWPVLASGYGVFGFGMLLSAAGFTGVAWHAEAATGPTILCFCAWVLLVATALRAPLASRT